jgi:hypothetical protein
VQVTEAREDPDQLVVEAALGHPFEAVAQQLETLNRIDGVHGALEREMDVEILDQHTRLVDETSPLGGAELAGLGNELTQRRLRSESARVEASGFELLLNGVRCGTNRDGHDLPP